MEQNILGRINQIKSNVQHLWDKFSDQDFEAARKKITDVSDSVRERIHKFTESSDKITPIHIDNYQYESHYPDDDLPLTLAKDSEPGVHFYDTENSPDARGALKSVARGLDKFGDEEDEVEEVFEEDIKRKAMGTKPRVKKSAPKKRQLH